MLWRGASAGSACFGGEFLPTRREPLDVVESATVGWADLRECRSLLGPASRRILTTGGARGGKDPPARRTAGFAGYTGRPLSVYGASPLRAAWMRRAVKSAQSS